MQKKKTQTLNFSISSQEEYLALYGDIFKPLPARDFALPGYVEGPKELRAADKPLLLADGKYLRKARTIAEKQAQYLKEKAELKAALRQAAADPGAAHPGLRALAVTLNAAAKKTSGTREALQLINAWANNRIFYDFAQLKKGEENNRARPLLAAVKSGKGICDDIARLKLFMLEELIERKKIDLKPSDVRWIGEDICRDGRVTTHAVIGVRIKGDQTWILDSQIGILKSRATTDDMLDKGAVPKSRTITIRQADGLMKFSSTIQIAAGHLETYGLQSVFPGKPETTIPRFSFNSSRASRLIPDGKPVVERPADTVPGFHTLTCDWIFPGGSLVLFSDVLFSAFSGPYKISLSTRSLVSGARLIRLVRSAIAKSLQAKAEPGTEKEPAVIQADAPACPDGNPRRTAKPASAQSLVEGNRKNMPFF